MEYKIEIEPLAYAQILEAVEFLKRVSFSAAESLYKEIMESISSLSSMPLRFPIDDTYKVSKEEERKMIICNGRYFILYCIENNSVHVEYFHDSRQNK